jgi:hypothetical protein
MPEPDYGNRRRRDRAEPVVIRMMGRHVGGPMLRVIATAVKKLMPASGDGPEQSVFACPFDQRSRRFASNQRQVLPRSPGTMRRSV